jgi:DNA-directed RNA polymerase specialized sigma24 family protein
LGCRVEARARQRIGLPPLELTDELVERIEALAGPALELIEQLPPGQEQAVRARVIDERDYDKIAKDLRCSEAVVRKRVSRGLAHMREELRDT